MIAPMVQYCYAIARPFAGEALSGLRGVQQAPVALVEAGALVAVVSPVPAVEFGEEPLRANLEKLSWLEEVARSHNHVVDSVAEHTTVLPFRLATLYRDEQRVQEVLSSGRDALGAALDRVAGRVEWGVKVYTQPASPRADASPEPTGEPPGRSYLRRRRAAHQSTEDAWQRASDAARHVDEALTPLAQDRRVHRPQNAELSGAPGHNVLNVAYLVPDESGKRFLDLARELGERTPGCRIEVTGPWVPYSFALGDAGPPA